MMFSILIMGKLKFRCEVSIEFEYLIRPADGINFEKHAYSHLSKTKLGHQSSHASTKVEDRAEKKKYTYASD